MPPDTAMELLGDVTLLRYNCALKKKKTVFLSLCVSVRVRVVLTSAGVHIRFPDDGVAGDCEPPDMAAVNCDQVLCKPALTC